MPVRRSDSLRSADSSQRRVSFNRAVHVKRIPRGQAPPAPALAVDQEGRLLPLPVRREKAPRSALELAREARKVLQQADSVSCTASSPSGVPIRPPRTPKTPPPPTSSQEEFRSRTLPYRRAHRGRIVVDLGNEVIYAQVVVSGQGSGVNKQTVHTSVKPPPSDEDEGLEIDAAYRPRHPNGYSVNLRNERNVSSTATSSSRLINEVNGGYNQSRVQQASTNVTRVNLNGRRIHDSTSGTTNNVPNGRSSSSNNTTERYYYSGDRRSQSPAMASARLVQQAADRSRDLPASSVLIRHWANSSQDKRSNGSSNTYQRKPRRRLDMEEDTDQDQRAREKQPLVNNKVVVEKEKKKRKMKMKNPFARDKKSPPPIREEQVTTRYSEYKGSNLHLKRTGSDSSRETPASHGPSDTDQGPWDEVDTATDYSRHRILDRSSSNPVHRQQRGPAPRGPSPVVRKSSGESASSLARSEPAINTRASKSSGGAASWFKSLDRLTFRTNKANKAAAAAASADTKKKEEAKNQKNLRFFGDTDQESVISTAHHHASAPAPQRQYRSNQNSRYQTSLAGRSSSSGARRGVQLRQSRQSASPNSSEDSENATTEGDSSLQSQRSVYLHAAAVGDIPGPGGPRRAISREELSSTSGRLQPQTRTLSRSISVLAPWRPRHYRNDAPEIHYDNESTATLRPNSATKPPRAPRSKMSAQSMESLHGSGSSPERARSTSRHRSSKAPAPQPPTSKSSNRMQQQQHHHRSGGTAVSRSASMPKDSRLAGWFRRKKLGSKETNTNNLSAGETTTTLQANHRNVNRATLNQVQVPQYCS
ncbi:hypothetical protein B566_EDAN005323 [Ephemera danica]|nr:hypothetical protein B566_EDAN005323 [Ephemera danica]